MENNNTEGSKLETEGNLITAVIFATTFPKNLLKAAALNIYDRVAHSKDVRSFNDRLEEYVEKSCEPYATKKQSIKCK